MNNITLTKGQIQAALDNLVTKPSGLNSMQEMTMNAFMKAERDIFLDNTNNNKANGYRQTSGLGIGEGLALNIPRDRLSQFKPWIIQVMRSAQDQMNDLCFELYGKGLTKRDLESITQSIYGQQLSRSSISRLTQTYQEEIQYFRSRQIKHYYPIMGLLLN